MMVRDQRRVTRAPVAYPRCQSDACGAPLTTNSIELLTCPAYGCPGCHYRHFHRTADDARLTEIPNAGLYTPDQLAVLGRAAIATGAVDRSQLEDV